MNKLTSGLFLCRWYCIRESLRDLGILLHRVIFVIKHGYYPQALWETYQYFIDAMKEIMAWKLNERSGDIPFKNCDEDSLPQVNDEFYTHFLVLLDKMNEGDQDSCNEFFTLFSKYFYHMWD